jgi:hypothetical protein
MVTWEQLFKDDHMTIPSEGILENEYITRPEYSTETEVLLQEFYNDVGSYLKALRDLQTQALAVGSYHANKPILFVNPMANMSENKWLSGLRDQCMVIPMVDIIFFNVWDQPLVNIYTQKILDIFKKISRTRKIILLSKESYNVANLYIRSHIPDSNFVWVIELINHGVLCIRKPISRQDFIYTLTKNGVVERADEIMPEFPETNKTFNEVFFAPNDNTGSYDWVLQDSLHMTTKDVYLAQTLRDQNWAYIQKMFSHVMRSHLMNKAEDEKFITKCALDNGLVFTSSMLYYRWIGPKHYWDFVQSGRNLGVIDPGLFLERDLWQSKTPYGRTTWISKYEPLERPIEQLVYMDLWHQYGYLIFNYMASDLQTFIDDRGLWNQKDYRKKYARRSLHYAQTTLPDMYIETLNTYSDSEYTYTLGQITTNTQGIQYSYNTLNVWLPRGFILILKIHNSTQNNT